MTASLRTKFLLSLLFGVAVFAALSFYADVGKLAGTLESFRWELLPAILGLTLLNYLLRFGKWQYYLRRIGVQRLSWWESFGLFFAGLSMVVTPGKVGEWLKSYLLREMTGTPFFRSAPVILAERLTDGLAMVLLASGGLVLFQLGWQIILLVLLTAIIALAVCWSPSIAGAAFALADRMPVAASKAQHLREFYSGARTVLRPADLVFGVTIGLVSWGGECLAFYLVLVGLGVGDGPRLALEAAFILAVASLGGSVLLVPGGLGVAEGSITGLLQWLLDMPAAPAVTAALLIRVCTLWFGVTLGLVMLGFVSRRAAQRNRGTKEQRMLETVAGPVTEG